MAQEEVEKIITPMGTLAERFIAAMGKYPEGVDRETGSYQRAVHFFFCKAYKTYQAIAVLCREGFIEDAEVLSRTLFELSLQVKWMSTDPKTMARSFTEHAPVRQYNMYLRMKKVKGARIEAIVSRIESSTSKLADLKTHYDQLKIKFLKPGKKEVRSPEDLAENWWGGSIRWLAEKAGMGEQYATVYWSQSDLVHTGSTSIAEYLKRDRDEWRANCYPNPDIKELGLTILWASAFFVTICQVLNAAWGLHLDSVIEQSFREVDDVGKTTLGVF